MRKFKGRIIGVISIFLIIICIAFIPQIYAEEANTAVTPLTCTELADRYGLYIQQGEEDETYVVIKDSKKACGNTAEDINKTFKIIAINGASSGNGIGSILSENNNSVKIIAGQLVSGTKHYVTVTLQNETAINETITIEFAIEKEPAGGGSIGKTNEHWNGLCNTFRQTAASKGEAGEQFFKQALPYCWQNPVTVNYTADELQKKIDNITKLWEIYNNQNLVGSSDFNTLFNEIKNKAHMKTSNIVADPLNTTLTLKCAYDRISTGSNEPVTYTNEYGDTISSTEYYLNKDYYYASDATTEGTVKYTYNFAPGNTVTETHDACKRTCEEAVKVEYGPPIASKAGLCFEYKVKVTSYVKCTSEIIAPEPQTFTNYCNPSPSCVSKSGTLRTLEQAGPKEDYERCVRTCDGGKYTEACSVKCYNQVYASDSTELAINYTQVKAQKQALSVDANSYTLAQCLEDNKDYYGCYMYISGAEESINWYSLKNYNLDGTSKSTIVYNDELALGRWYIDRVYKKNYGYDFSNPNYNRSTGGYNISKIDACTTAEIKAGKKYCGEYISDEDGVYRHYYASSNSLCNDDCVWRTDVCPKSATSVNGNSYLNPGTMEKDAKANQAEYEAAATACLASATCSEHTAEFSISINYDTKTGEQVKVNTISFPYETKADTLVANQPNNVADASRSTILNYAGCYENKNVGNHYMTEWSFPGTYIHNKTGEISFKRPDVTDGWYYDDKKFCMPLDARSVNKKWWEWAKLGNTCYTRAEIEEELKGQADTSNGYNISASTKKFGYFGWNFDIKCFYAIRNETCNVKDNGCCNNDVTQKKESGVDNYTFRSIDLDNMFPNAKEEGVIDPDKRAIGFNWTSKAASLKNSNYEVNPTALINHIQNSASTIHSDETTNLDYRFYLTPATLAKIKSYNNSNDYATWDGTIEEINGINVYKSNLFRNVGTGSKVLSEISGAVIKVGEPGINNENYIAFGGY